MSIMAGMKAFLRWRESEAVFVVGTGRSGTHWLGYVLSSHPDIETTIEAQPIFRWVTEMALDSASVPRLFPRLARAYKWNIVRAAPKLYADKSHPNLWLAGELKRVLPRARFVGIERNPFSTVASMIRHGAVRRWHEKWRDFPVPNRFLGIDQEVAEIYDSLSLATRGAMRWVSHRDELERLRCSIGGSVHFIRYEEMAADPVNAVNGLRVFLQLKRSFPIPEVRSESLEKWRKNLDARQIAEIESVVGFGPD